MLVCVFVSDCFSCVDLDGGGGGQVDLSRFENHKLLYVSLEILVRTPRVQLPLEGGLYDSLWIMLMP